MAVAKGRSKGPSLPQRPIWMTEQGGYLSGADGIFTGVLNGPRATRWISLMYFAQNIVTRERMTVETAPYWYDGSHGFDSQPTWWVNGAMWGMGPTLLPVRTMQAEIYGKKFSKELNFGEYGQNLYIGAKWQASDGSQVLGICGTSYGLPSVNLAVTGATSVTFVDGWGNASSLAVTGGIASFPTSEFPQWVRLPAGVNAELVASDWQWGKNYTPQAIPTATGNQAKLHYLVEEPLRNIWDYQSEDYTSLNGCYFDGSGSYPQTLKWDFQRTITLDQIALFSSVPWHDQSAFTDFTVDVSTDNSTWTNVYTHAAPSSVELATTSRPWRTKYDSFWQQDWAWLIRFSPASARYVRVVVNGTSYGQDFSSATNALEMTTGHQYLLCQGMQAFYRAGTNPDKTTAFSAPPDISGLIGWYDPSDSSSLTIVSSTHVSKMKDKSGYGNDVTQSTDGLRPTTGSTINGVAALSYVRASSQTLTASLSPALLMRQFYAVVKPTDVGDTKGVIGFGNGPFEACALFQNEAWMYGSNNNDGNTSATLTAGVGAAIAWTAGPVDTSGHFLISLNGTEQAIQHVTNYGARNGVQIGSGGGGGCFNGQIGECLIYNRAHTAAERATVMSYLKTKWGTP